jgi:hypothetical protein
MSSITVPYLKEAVERFATVHRIHDDSGLDGHLLHDLQAHSTLSIVR